MGSGVVVVVMSGRLLRGVIDIVEGIVVDIG